MQRRAAGRTRQPAATADARRAQALLHWRRVIRHVGRDGTPTYNALVSADDRHGALLPLRRARSWAAPEAAASDYGGTAPTRTGFEPSDMCVCGIVGTAADRNQKAKITER